MKNLKAKGIILITLFVLLLLPSYILNASNYNDNDDYEEYIDEEYPPVDLDIWPDLQYVLEVDSSMLGEGAIHRQFYGKYAVRLETISDEVEYNVIYKFKEDGVDEIVLLNQEEEYMVNSISYNEFFEMNDSFEYLLYRTLPGEEAAPGVEKIGEVEYLDRKVEEWSYIDSSEGEPVTINLLVDRELRQILKITFNGEVSYNVTKIEIKELSPDLFNPPDNYKALEY